jgi:hypothetical protein
MTTFDHVNDSGERRSFGTGSVRDVRTGKGRYDLIPPLAIKRIAQHFENGAVKYGDKTWELGQPLSSYLDSGLRHTFNLLDLKVDEDHAAAGIWNLIAFLCTADWIIEGRLPRDLDDIGYCDALEEAREDAELENLADIGHAQRVFTGGGPADGPIEAPMVADYVGGIPPSGEQTTVLSRASAPEAVQPEEYGADWTVVETSPTSFFAYSPDVGDAPVRFQAGPPAETTDLRSFVERVNEITRALAEQAWPFRYVAGLATEDVLQALKDRCTEEVPAAAEHLQGDATLYGLQVYEVPADDPLLAGNAWAVVPEALAQQAVQRSLDSRD